MKINALFLGTRTSDEISKAISMGYETIKTYEASTVKYEANKI